MHNYRSTAWFSDAVLPSTIFCKWKFLPQPPNYVEKRLHDKGEWPEQIWRIWKLCVTRSLYTNSDICKWSSLERLWSHHSCLACMLNTVMRMAIARQRLGNHIPEITISKIVGHPVLGNGPINMHSWQRKTVHSVGSLPRNYKRAQSGKVEEYKGIRRSTAD
jgi:hypothetical protein